MSVSTTAPGPPPSARGRRRPLTPATPPEPPVAKTTRPVTGLPASAGTRRSPRETSRAATRETRRAARRMPQARPRVCAVDVKPEDPRAEDVVALLGEHLRDMRA